MLENLCQLTWILTWIYPYDTATDFLTFRVSL